MKPICVCWKTSRNAKASHFGRGVCGADGEGKDAAKEPDTQRYAPCLSEPSYRNAAGVISPGLPSQALTRQLPQSGSPWQRGVVLLRLIEVCWKTSRTAKASPTRKDSPGRGRWHASAERGQWHRAKRRCRRGCTEQHLRYPAHSKGVLCPTSQSRIRSPAVPLSALACHLPRPGESFLAGEPLAKRFRFR